MSRIMMKTVASGSLMLGLLLLATGDGLFAAPNPKDAPKYTADLKTSKDAKVKITALGELGRLGQVNKALIKEAYPLMVKALEDKEMGVRAAAAKAVGMVDPGPEVLPILVKMMNNEKEIESVRLAAIQGIGSMGVEAKSAVKDLRAVMKKADDKKSKMSRAANNAIRTINMK